MQRTTGLHKALSWKATSRERGKTPENCWLEEKCRGRWVHYGAGCGIIMHHGQGVNLRREELQTDPNVEVADRDPCSFLKPWDIQPPKAAKSAPPKYTGSQRKEFWPLTGTSGHLNSLKSNKEYCLSLKILAHRKGNILLSPHLSVTDFQEEQNVPIASLLLKALARIRSKNLIFFCFSFDTSQSSPTTKLSMHECLPQQKQ